MKNTYSIVSLLSSFVRLSPLHQFWLNILIPAVGIIFFHWTPGAVLFCFIIELINYCLCNAILLLFYVTDEPANKRITNTLKFSFWFSVSLIGFYYFIVFMTNAKDSSMETNVTYGQIIAMTVLYWLQFIWYLGIEQPKEKITTAIIYKEVSNRMTGIYLTMFCLIGYIFSFWSQTRVMNFAMAFVMIFAKNLTDWVLISLKMSRGRKGK